MRSETQFTRERATRLRSSTGSCQIAHTYIIVGLNCLQGLMKNCPDMMNSQGKKDFNPLTMCESACGKWAVSAGCATSGLVGMPAGTPARPRFDPNKPVYSRYAAMGPDS